MRRGKGEGRRGIGLDGRGRTDGGEIDAVAGTAGGNEISSRDGLKKGGEDRLAG